MLLSVVAALTAGGSLTAVVFEVLLVIIAVILYVSHRSLKFKLCVALTSSLIPSRGSTSWEAVSYSHSSLCHCATFIMMMIWACGVCTGTRTGSLYVIITYQPYHHPIVNQYEGGFAAVFAWATTCTLLGQDRNKPDDQVRNSSTK